MQVQSTNVTNIIVVTPPSLSSFTKKYSSNPHMNTLTKILPLVAFLKIAFSCPDDCSFAKEDSKIPAKGIGIDWGVFFSQIQVKDIRFFGLGIENYFYFSNNIHHKGSITKLLLLTIVKAVSSWRKCWLQNVEYVPSSPRVK